MMITCRY